MTLIQVAVLFLRISGVGWLIDVVVALTALPGDILGMVAQSGYLSAQRELAIAMLLVRVCFYLGMAIAFLIFPRPLAKLFTKGLEHVA
jgi:hypothetical protein